MVAIKVLFTCVKASRSHEICAPGSDAASFIVEEGGGMRHFTHVLAGFLSPQGVLNVAMLPPNSVQQLQPPHDKNLL